MPSRLELVVNGQPHSVPADPARSLLAVLREELDLTGAKPGCGEGECGACTVLVAGEAVRSCTLPLEHVLDRPVTTIEALATAGVLHPVQQAFVELRAMQCGYCTPGMVMSTTALLAAHPSPDGEQVRAALDGNVCRCGAYPSIENAVQRAAELVRTPAPLRPAADDREFPRPRAPWDLTEPADRDWFDVLGDGVVVVVPPPARPGAWALTGGVWIHVGPDGAVTAFTGKVDVGQGTRAALGVVVARGLGVDPAVVRVVMGDTDLCPFDVGTFGSLSMPTVEPQVRVAARAARQRLHDMGVDPATLSASNRLVGVRRIDVIDDEPQPVVSVVPAAGVELSGVGSREAVAAVTGARRYPTDVRLPGMGYGAVLHAPSPASTPVHLDVGPARALTGVTVVHEGDFVGVVADDLASARRAIDAIDVTWSEPSYPSEAELAAHLRAHPVTPEGRGGASEHVGGDVGAALRGAPVAIERTYEAAYIAHVPMETRAALATWDQDRLTVFTGTQRPFGTRAALAAEMGVAESEVRVVVPTTGAGFGGKHSPEVAIEAARLARAVSRPVNVVWSREEEFVNGYVRPAAVIDVRGGASSDGNLLGWELTNINAGDAGLVSPYAVVNRRERFQPAASPLRQGSYRALAATVNNFARESVLDELAHELRLDPLDLRLRNLRDDRLAAVARAAADCFGWDHRSREEGMGSGIAIGLEKGGRIATCTEVYVDADRVLEVLRVVSAFECGAIVSEDDVVRQIEGATVMGLGGALFEAVHFAAGRILNARLSEYRVPRFSDIPRIEVVVLDRPDLPSAGAGETPIITIAPALANAIFAATGLRLRRLPLLPELERVARDPSTAGVSGATG